MECSMWQTPTTTRCVWEEGCECGGEDLSVGVGGGGEWMGEHLPM